MAGLAPNAFAVVADVAFAVSGPSRYRLRPTPNLSLSWNEYKHPADNGLRIADMDGNGNEYCNDVD